MQLYLDDPIWTGIANGRRLIITVMVTMLPLALGLRVPRKNRAKGKEIQWLDTRMDNAAAWSLQVQDAQCTGVCTGFLYPVHVVCGRRCSLNYGHQGRHYCHVCRANVQQRQQLECHDLPGAVPRRPRSAHARGVMRTQRSAYVLDATDMSARSAAGREITLIAAGTACPCGRNHDQSRKALVELLSQGRPQRTVTGGARSWKINAS